MFYRRLSSFPRGSIVASHLSLPMSERKASSVVPDELLEPEGAQPIWNALKEMVNLTLLVNPIFLLVGISNVFGMLGFYVPFVYLPNMAVLRGVSVENANFLLSIIGKLQDSMFQIEHKMNIYMYLQVFQIPLVASSPDGFPISVGSILS